MPSESDKKNLVTAAFLKRLFNEICTFVQRKGKLSISKHLKIPITNQIIS